MGIENFGNKAAFPSNYDESELPPRWGWGLTKRELFAAMMLQALISDARHMMRNDNRQPEPLAHGACEYADALIAELAKDKT